MTRITCPHCSRKGTSSKTVPVGAKVKCPGCGNAFRYEGTGHAVAEVSPATSTPFSDAPPASPVVSIPPVITPAAPQLAGAPTDGPHQQGNQMAVPKRQQTNAMGIAALGLGVLAVLIAWKQFLGSLAVPLGLLGGLLGAIGLVYGLIGRRRGILAAGVGIGLSLGGIILSVAITGARREAAEYNMKAAEKYIEFQQSLRGIAAREGKTPTDKFTKEILDEVKASEILMPEEYVAAKEAFLDYGGQYVSPTDEPGSRRIERSTLKAILPTMMAYAKACKISSRIVARFIAVMIKIMPKGSSAEDYQRVFSKVVVVAVKEMGSAETTLAQLTPFLSEQVGEDMPFGGGEHGILSAAAFLMVQEYAHPGESYSYSTELMRTLDYFHRSGLEGELGITAHMTPKQKMEAVKQAWKKSGEEKFEDFLEPYLRGMEEKPASLP